MKKFLAMIAVSLGLALTTQAHSASMIDIKASTAQIFDVQWSVSGTTFNASGFTRPYTSSAGQLTVTEINAIAAANQYFGFFDSTTAPGTYGMAVYNSDGTVARVIHNTGTFRVLSSDVIFYLGNGFWGTVISITEGFNYGDSKSWTSVISNPTSAQITSYVPGATAPLAAGETASAPPPAPPAPPAVPTVVSTAPGTAIVVVISSTGATTAAVTTSNAIGENSTHQTVTTTVTTVLSTPTTTITCTTPTTVTTYSDNTTTTTNGAQTCVSSTTVATTSSATVSTAAGRIDQLQTLSNYNHVLNSTLDRDLFRRDWVDTEHGRMYVTASTHRATAGNGYTADGEVYGIGVERDINAATVLGLRANRASSDLKGTDSTSGQQKDHFAVYSTTETAFVDLHIDANIAKNNYRSARHVGAYSNSVSTTGTDIWITLMGSREVASGVTPFAGVTTGQQKIGGYAESGSALTARSVSNKNTDMNYATVGVNISKNIQKVNVGVTAAARTDSLQSVKIYVDTLADKTVKLSLSATETKYKNIRNTSVGVGLNVRF